jgi:hypothetical protein
MAKLVGKFLQHHFGERAKNSFFQSEAVASKDTEQAIACFTLVKKNLNKNILLVHFRTEGRMDRGAQLH